MGPFGYFLTKRYLPPPPTHNALIQVQRTAGSNNKEESVRSPLQPAPTTPFHFSSAAFKVSFPFFLPGNCILYQPRSAVFPIPIQILLRAREAFSFEEMEAFNLPPFAS